jgi:DNA-directed RNA polymerase subunit RPC12/RpoP
MTSPENIGQQFQHLISTMGISPEEQAAMGHSALIGHHQDEAAKPETFTPCDRCGTSIPTDVHKEEMGMCVDCSHKYYNHEFDEEDHSMASAPSDMYKCGVCGKNSATSEENMNHECFK